MARFTEAVVEAVTGVLRGVLRGVPVTAQVLLLQSAAHIRARGPRIGVFGGTFDPPHVGHLVTAVNVRHELQLDTVLLMVANVPWQKVGSRPISPASQRFAMVRSTVADVPGLEASDIEIVHGGPSYTADTLEALAHEHPDAQLFTIVGDDATGAHPHLGASRAGRHAQHAGGRGPPRPATGAAQRASSGNAWRCRTSTSPAPTSATASATAGHSSTW